MSPKFFGLFICSLFLAPSIGSQSQQDKDQILSRKRWFLTYEFALHGSGSGASDSGGSSSWTINRYSTGSIELNHSIPGQWPASTPVEPNMHLQTGRFMTWMAMPSEQTFAAMDQGETDPAKLPGHFFPFFRNVRDHKEWRSGREWHTDDWTGSGEAFAIGPCMLAIDLKTGTYDLLFSTGPTDLGNPVTYRYEGTDNNGVEEVPPTHHIAWLPNAFVPQLLKRNLWQEIKSDGSISFQIIKDIVMDGTGGRENPTLRASFTISPTPPTTARLVLRADQDYHDYRPVPGDDERKPGNSLTIDWAVEMPGVPPADRPEVTKIEFKLEGVSRHKGVCMNWPATPLTTPDPDLQFSKNMPQDADRMLGPENQSYTLIGVAANSFNGSIQVDCFDGAAIGNLTAVATLSDGRVLKGLVEHSGLLKLLIPDREENVSEIAKSWRSEHASNLEDAEDREDKPEGDGQVGDGLSVWEEYRGFRQGGKWVDNCDPKKKDLFVENRVGGTATAGIKLFERTTDLVVHKDLKRLEHKIDRVINFNVRGDRHIVDQHCLILRVSDNPNAGTAEGMFGAIFPGPPKNTQWVNVIMGQPEDAIFAVGPRGTLRTANYQTQHIAHELGHAIGIYHHGDVDPWTDGKFGVIWFWPADGAPAQEGGRAFYLYDEATLSGLRSPAGSQERVGLGFQQGQHSGSTDCIMRYSVAIAYPYRVGGLDRDRIWADRPQPPGRTLCDSRLGSEFNATGHNPHPRFGDTDPKRGDCRHQFVISDKWEAKDRR